MRRLAQPKARSTATLGRNSRQGAILMRTCLMRAGPRAGMAAAVLAFSGATACAERIENQVAVFSALDKVTARISKFEVEINKTVAFGNIKVTPRACYSRPQTELPKTTTFVEVDETLLDGTQKRIFTGWMFAESPASSASSIPPSTCGSPSAASRAVRSRKRRPHLLPHNPRAALPLLQPTTPGPLKPRHPKVIRQPR